MISIVMTTYNGEEYIIEQLESIFHQTMPCDEMIICDDHSTDHTVPLIEEFIASHQLQTKWKLFCNDKNLGYENNFKQAIQLSKGDYLFFSDQDDIWVENKIEIMMNTMLEHGDCVLLCTGYQPYVESGDSRKIPKKIKKNIDSGILENKKITKKSIYIGALGCCMAVKKTFLEEIEPYWFDNWPHDDRMWRLAQCVNGCFILHSQLVKHRIHDHNTATYTKYHTIEKRVILLQKMQNANIQMLKMIKEKNSERDKMIILENHIQMMKLRLELLSNKKLINILKLIKYWTYYEYFKSYFVEIYLVLFH